MFEAAGEELVKSCETNEDEAEDAQTDRSSWIALQIFILASLSELPLEVI